MSLQWRMGVLCLSCDNVSSLVHQYLKYSSIHFYVLLATGPCIQHKSSCRIQKYNYISK